MVETPYIAGIEYFLPLLAFLVVWIVAFFVLNRDSIIKSKWVAGFFSFVLATVCVVAAGPRNYVLAIIPWFAVVIVGVFLFMALFGFLGDNAGVPGKTIGKTFIIIMAVIFIASAFFVFYGYFEPYLPGSTGEGGNPALLRLFDWIYSPRVFGALLLLGISLIVGWMLVRKSGGK